jgi:diguanylate cyclase (GGDEF)-like protein
MYTFTQLFIRNTLLGLVFFSLILASSGQFLADYLNKVQQIQIATTKVIAEQSADNTSAFVKALKASNQFDLLTIDTLDGNSLYHYASPNPSKIIPFVTPENSSISLVNYNLKVSFKLNFSDLYLLAVQWMIIILIAILTFAGIAALISVRRYQQVFSHIGEVINEQLNYVVTHGKVNEPAFNNFELNAIKQGLKALEQLFAQQQSTTQQLENKAYIDPLTQLDNRGRFVQYFETEIHQDKKSAFGVLLITRCSELQTINQLRGYNEGDRYICKVAQLILSVLHSYQGGKLFRLNSSDFAIILPNTTLTDGERFADKLTAKFNDYQQTADLDSVAYTGIVNYNEKSPLGELLALADTAISVAQTRNKNSWFAQKDNEILANSSATYGNQNWRQEIDNVVDNQRITLLVQPIHPNNRTSKVYGEILARFLNAQDEMLPTASFVAMAEKLDKIVAVDRLIIETAIREISEKHLTEQHFGINISARSIHDNHFVIWLERLLLRESNIASRLVFEITEFGLQQNIQSSKRFIDMLHRAGARLTVERFGVGLTSFKFFRDLKPDFIKMDSTYTRDIDEDKNNQYFLRLMVDLAHRLSINVLAESVETLEEKHTLEKLFVDGCQGYYIGKPAPL